MAATTGAPSSPDDTLSILINTIVRSLKPVYITLIVTCIWSAMLVPLFVVLLFLSDKEMRRKPIFFGNLFAIALGVAYAGVVLELMVSKYLHPWIASLHSRGMTDIYCQMSVLVDPLAPPSIPLTLTFATIMACGPLLVESVLVLRLWAVYPFRSTPRAVFFAIFIPITLLKIGRVVNTIIYLVSLSRQIDKGENALVLLQNTWASFPNYKIDWFIQVVDNTFTSLLFLCKLHKGRGLKTRFAGRHWGSAIEALFWIAASNFVIPVMLSIAQLVVIWISKDIFDVSPISIVNFYVEIIGVLLATVWAAGAKWQDEQVSTRSAVHVGTTADTEFVMKSISATST